MDVLDLALIELTDYSKYVVICGFLAERIPLYNLDNLYLFMSSNT